MLQYICQWQRSLALDHDHEVRTVHMAVMTTWHCIFAIIWRAAHARLRRGVPRTSLTLVARVLHGVIVWAPDPGRIGCLCNGLYAVLSSGIVFRASFSKMKNDIIDTVGYC